MSRVARLFPLLCFLLLLAAPTAQAGIYKWKDAQGRVHYTDTPPPGTEAQRVSVDKTDEASAAAARRSLADRLTESALRRRMAQEDEEKRAAEERQRRLRAEACLKAREQLTLLQQNLRISRVDPSGRIYFMGEAERAAAIEEALKRVAEYCNY